MGLINNKYAYVGRYPFEPSAYIEISRRDWERATMWTLHVKFADSDCDFHWYFDKRGRYKLSCKGGRRSLTYTPSDDRCRMALETVDSRMILFINGSDFETKVREIVFV